MVYGGTVTRLAGWQQVAQIKADHKWTQDELLARAPELAENLVAPPPVFDVVTPGSIQHGQATVS